MVMLNFGLYNEHATNQRFSFHFLHNEGVVETMALCSSFLSTPALFMCKMIVKSAVYPGRCVIIKVPLTRVTLQKKNLRAYLRRRAVKQASFRLSITGGRSLSERSVNGGSLSGGSSALRSREELSGIDNTSGAADGGMADGDASGRRSGPRTAKVEPAPVGES